MSIQAVELSRENYSVLEHVCIQIISIQAVDFSRAHHAALERVYIQH